MNDFVKDHPNEPPPGFDYWTGDHPDHLFADWQNEVANDYTRKGYWQWVRSRMDEA